MAGRPPRPAGKAGAAAASPASGAAKEGRAAPSSAKGYGGIILPDPQAPVPKEVPPGFGFHGYLRSGYGVTGNGRKQVPFQAPDAPAKYRLGNEVDTYGELALVQKFERDQSQPFFRVQVRVAYSSEEHKNWDPDGDKFILRESFVEAGDFAFMPSAKFWAGQRFYRRLDIHINDFYVFDMSAYGGGVEGLDLGLGKARLAVAYLGGSTDDYEFPKPGRVSKNTFDLRLYGFDLPYGHGMLWLAPSWLKGGQYVDSAGKQRDYSNTSGYALGLVHQHDIPRGGYNRFTLQYGRGSGSNVSPVVRDPQ